MAKGAPSSKSLQVGSGRAGKINDDARYSAFEMRYVRWLCATVVIVGEFGNLQVPQSPALA
jgi:hypothetical protein